MSPQLDHLQSHRTTVSDVVRSGLLSRSLAAVTAILLGAMAAIGSVDAAPRAKPDQIRYKYIRPTDPSHQAIYDQIKQGRALELLQQLLSPLRLPHPLTLKVASCEGFPTPGTKMRSSHYATNRCQRF